MKTNLVIRFIFKEFFARTFRLFGGLYLIKYALRKAPIYLVLNYHNFSLYNNYRFKRGSILETGYATNFDKQMRFLKKYFTFLYPEEFFEAEPEKGLNILISFDDGYKDNYNIAFPILKKHQAKSIFFVVSAIIGTNEWLQHDKILLLRSNKSHIKNEAEITLRKLNKGIAVPENIIRKSNQYFSSSSFPVLMMNWSNLKELQDHGFKIMPHTNSHVGLSFLNKDEQEKEIIDSVNRIASKLHQKPVYFAYPNGLYDSRTIKILKSKGIKYGFTTIKGINTKNDKRLELKRIGINASDSIAVMLLKIFMAAIK